MPVMRALLDSGLAIPSDIAIVGCGNLPICEFLRPLLTSIWLQPDEAGRAASDRIHALIGGRNPPVGRAPVRSKLVLREVG